MAFQPNLHNQEIFEMLKHEVKEFIKLINYQSQNLKDKIDKISSYIIDWLNLI